MHLKKIRSIALAAFCLVLMTTSCLAGSPSVQDILKYTNEYRKSKGRAALVLDENASELAQRHSKNMAKGKTPFGHSGFKDRVQALSQGGTFISAAAENVAYGNMTARQVVDGWINSATHRKNMLGSFNHIGIGIAEGRDGRLYFTQLFFKR